MAERTTFSRRYLTYVLAVLFLANFLSYLDRHIVSAFEEEITQSLAINSAKFGLLWTAFTIGYMLISPFIGYYADRVHRGRLFAVCILVWSAATIGSGLTGDNSYGLLFAMRTLIGIGEAGCLIIGSTLVVDYFPRRMRGRAMSFFFLGMPLGAAFGFVLAGIIKKMLGWQWAFYVAGLPGIVLAGLIFFLKQPARGASDLEPHEREDLAHSPLPSANLSSYIALLKIPTLFLLIIAQAFASFTLVPLVHFGVHYFENVGLSKVGATSTLGGMALVAGLLGNALGGWLGDLGRKRHPGAYSFLTGVAFAIGCPATIVGLRLVSHPGVAEFVGYACIFVSFTMFFMCMPLINTQMANVVRPQQRAVAFAAAIFVLHLLGDTFSPWLFGVVKDQTSAIFAFTIFPLSLILAALLSFASFGTAPRDVAAVSRHVGESSSASLPPQPKS